MFAGGQPPGPHAGDISPATEALRPYVRMSRTHCAAARRLRRSGFEVGQIAASLGVTVDEVEEGLATMRTRRREVTRGNLNVTTAAREFVLNEADGGTVWSTVDRLFVELMYWRARAGAPLVRGSLVAS